MRQRIAYNLGRELPAYLHDWVLHDLTGPYAMERYLVRFIVPFIPLYGFVLLFPGPMHIKWQMIVIMAVPMVVFTVAHSYVWRRFRLTQHGLDPGIVDRSKSTAYEKERYRMRYGH
ncbi:DUF5313 family protein [Nocardia sp. NPDC060256]|uniref:DUF5313 family protein n=1 Tax=unclassified Nocardia TaxID=2637762 RepID=UPI0036673CBE